MNGDDNPAGRQGVKRAGTIYRAPTGTPVGHFAAHDRLKPCPDEKSLSVRFPERGKSCREPLEQPASQSYRWP
jgi:hypothetical protein